MAPEVPSPSPVQSTRKAAETSEAETVAMAVKAAIDIIREIRSLVAELVEQTMKALDGAKLGREVGEFYKNLVESGVPDEMAKQLTMEFFKQRLEAAPKLSSLIEALAKEISGIKGPKLAEKIVVVKGREKGEKKAMLGKSEESEEEE